MSWGGQHPYQGAPGSQYGGAPGYGQQPAGYQPPHGQGAYRAPPPQGAYGAPPPTAPGAYHAPPAGQQGGYRPPPPGQPGGYRPPPPTQQYGGYGAPPPQQTGYRPPPPQAPYQAPGAGGYPPPGVSQDLWGWFQSVDTDRSGKITATELQQALHNGNWTPFNAETCRLMIGMFDRDKSGTIDIHEFSALWKYIQDWKACFDRFDTDRSGNINSSELGSAFKSFGYNLSMNFVNICMRTYDRRGVGSINFDDFIQCCVMLKALTDKFREKDTQQNGMVRIHYEDFLRMVLDNSIVL